MELPEELKEFAYIPNFLNKIEQLKGKIMTEPWNYHDESDSTNPVLVNYLSHTYNRLVKERETLELADKNKVIFLKQEQACINTGLINDDYEYLYMYFEKNTNPGQQPWVFKSYLKEKNPWLNRQFSPLPKRAKFFSEISNLIFDTSKRIEINMDHIREHKERLPGAIRDSLNLETIINGALDVAKRKIEVNYKTAVPQYYDGEVQFLIPLCLLNTKDVDVALVVKDYGQNYFGKTCFTLDMAYNNARLIAKPESNWLIP
ncbi:DUF3825 domain-containing protein [Sporolactobacillus sp. KGMB 08714]|uniref:DUF3825 domain-containing protein n=1 Tax=Sporolactobacillus sp. KGMB 08714 TaxID=3064704 RepID=UPI002FBEB1C2